MKAYLDCIPCIVRQGLQTARFSTADEALHRRIVEVVLARLAEADFAVTPMVLGLVAQRAAQEITGVQDAYADVRARSNAEAQKLYPRLKDIVASADDPLLTAAKVAAAGNIIDFGALGEDFDVEATLARVIARPFTVDHYPQFAEAASRAQRVLYLADNAGEIVFDRVLIEALPGRDITVTVRAEPYINDALLADAQAVGLTEVAEVIAAPLAPRGDPAFEQAWHAADIIISKGQANYETHSEAEGPLFFLLIAKCDFVARDLGIRKHEIALKAR